MNKGKIIIISGPSGSGKTTLYKKLLNSRRLKGKLVKSVSMTTRLRRKGEKDGRDYFFISRKMFLAKKKTNQFLECKQVFGNYYGTPKRHVLKLMAKGKSVLLCIDVKGAKDVRRRYKKVYAIFIKAPSMKILAKRLQGRGSENRKDLQARLNVAKKELLEAKKYNCVIVNKTITNSYKKLEKIVCQALNV